jgi:glycosyltransferase involved in cell wall biosynthesis
MKAIPNVVKSHKDVVFLIVGSGSLTQKMKSFVKSKGVEKHVIFIKRVPWEDMPKYMNTADIYVSTSLSDGSSAALLEAMACGKAVAVSRIPANLEWVKDNWNGTFFEKRDHIGVGKSLLRIIEDEKLTKKFGKRNLEIVKNRANLKKGLLTYEKAMIQLTSN